MSESRIAILMGLSRELKTGRPISLSSYEPGPLEDEQDRVHDANIRDILRRRYARLPQIFSGVSDDSVTQKMINEVQ